LPDKRFACPDWYVCDALLRNVAFEPSFGAAIVPNVCGAGVTK
jgi:hypothetical protein